MAKGTVSSIRRKSQPVAPPSVPLSDITIMWPPLNDFEGEPETPITITGQQLGQMVAWLARSAPYMLKRPGDNILDRQYQFLQLEGIAGLLKAVGSAGADFDSERPAVCAFLAHAVQDCAARLAAMDDVKTDLKRAVVTVGAVGAEAAQ
jgi:hypothetical protein